MASQDGTMLSFPGVPRSSQQPLFPSGRVRDNLPNLATGRTMNSSIHRVLWGVLSLLITSS